MTFFNTFRVQAYNNAWANYRLLSACEKLSAYELTANRTSFFPSIIETLNHIITVDWFYVSALEGTSIGYSAFDPEIPYPDIADLIKEQRIVDRRLIDICEELNETSGARPIDIVRETWTQTERTDRTLLHLFQHQIHHRGQVHAMLSDTNVMPPQLDEFFLGHEIEQALRSDDFAELKFSENHIWR